MESTERKPAGWGRIVGLVVLLPVLYLASIGPIAGIITRTGMRPIAVRLFEGYAAPASALCDVSPRLRQVLQGYVNWFMPDFVPAPAPPARPPAP